MLLAIDIYFVAEMIMRARIALMSAALIAAGSIATGQAPDAAESDDRIDGGEEAGVRPLCAEQSTSARGAQGAQGARGAQGAQGAQGARSAPPTRTAAQLAAGAMANANTDFIFDGTMEGGMDRALPAFSDFVKGMAADGSFHKNASKQLTHPLVVKMHEIAPDHKVAAESIGKQLNLGVSGIMFVSVESAAEAQAGINAMRFKSKGGTRSEDVGQAPALWGISEKEYREKADLWPLNPNGELINWTIIESKEGLEKVREIAAVKGIGVLWPGAGTLRGLFSHHRRERRAQARRSGLGSRDSESARRLQGIQRRVRLPRQPHRHRDAHEAGLQRVRHELGRSGIQGDRDRKEGR